MDDALNADPLNAQAGMVTSKRTADQQITFAATGTYGTSPLGYGTALSQAAMRLLGAKRQTRIA